VQDWPQLYRQCLRCLKPGGWLEQQEFALPIAANDGELPADSVWHSWGDIFREAGSKMGRTFEVTKDWEEWLRTAGFDGVIYTHAVRLPIGSWPKEKRWKDVGWFNRMSLEQGLEGFASYLCTQVLGWGEQEIAVLLAKVRHAITDRTTHAYYPL
jgi:hypothetical protein